MFTKKYHDNTIKEVLDFKLGDVTKNEKINIIEITCKFMHGDADYYTTKTLNFDLDGKSIDGEINFKSSMNFLLRCFSAFPHGMGGDDGYWEVDGWNDEWEDFFPQDNDGCDGHASPSNISAFYYNSSGIKCSLDLDIKETKA